VHVDCNAETFWTQAKGTFASWPNEQGMTRGTFVEVNNVCGAAALGWMTFLGDLAAFCNYFTRQTLKSKPNDL
jgi:hypothetical protein